jgi:hypothetical protein
MGFVHTACKHHMFKTLGYLNEKNKDSFDPETPLLVQF